MSERLRKFHRDQAGVSLIIVIFSMMILAILGWTLANLISGDFEMNSRALQGDQALYLADAGIQEAMVHLALGDTVFDTDTKWLNRTLAPGEYNVNRTTSGSTVNITSSGYVPNRATYRAMRQVKLRVQSGGFTFGSGTAIYSTGTVSLSGNADVNGNVTQNAPPASLPPVVVPDPPLNSASLGALSVQANNQVTLAAGNYKYSSIALSGNSKLTIYGPSNIYLTGNPSFTTAGNANLVITGGRVNIYIDGALSIAGNGVIGNSSSVANLIFWGTPSNHNTVTLSGNGNFYGVIYAPGMDFKISGNGNYVGEYVGGSVTMSGNSEITYDPAVGSIVMGGGGGSKEVIWQEQ